MLNFEPRLSPEQYAIELACELKLSYPFRPVEAVQQLGLLYLEKDMGNDGGFDGCLIRKNRKAAIVLNKNISNESRKYFTIAHELGHYRIKGHDQKLYSCFGKEIEGLFTDHGQESEANRFAAELLLPSKEIEKIIKLKPLNMSLVKDLANHYGTSLTSTLIRLVKLDHIDTCAAILSEKSRVKWFIPSYMLRCRYEVKLGSLSENTCAYDFFVGKDIPNEPQKVRPDSWIGGSKITDLAYIVEESVALSQWGLVLTLITVPEEDE